MANLLLNQHSGTVSQVLGRGCDRNHPENLKRSQQIPGHKFFAVLRNVNKLQMVTVAYYLVLRVNVNILSDYLESDPKVCCKRYQRLWHASCNSEPARLALAGYNKEFETNALAQN